MGNFHTHAYNFIAAVPISIPSQYLTHEDEDCKKKINFFSNITQIIDISITQILTKDNLTIDINSSLHFAFICDKINNENINYHMCILYNYIQCILRFEISKINYDNLSHEKIHIANRIVRKSNKLSLHHGVICTKYEIEEINKTENQEGY